MNYGLLLLGEHSRERLLGLARQFRAEGFVTRTVPVRDGKVIFSDRVQFPVRPMVGVIGTAPVGESVNKSIDLKIWIKEGAHENNRETRDARYRDWSRPPRRRRGWLDC